MIPLACVCDTSAEAETVVIPPACVCAGELVEEVFSAADHVLMHNRVILSPTNECQQVNERVLGTLQGKPGTEARSVRVSQLCPYSFVPYFSLVFQFNFHMLYFNF